MQRIRGRTRGCWQRFGSVVGWAVVWGAACGGAAADDGGKNVAILDEISYPLVAECRDNTCTGECADALVLNKKDGACGYLFSGKYKCMSTSVIFYSYNWVQCNYALDKERSTSRGCANSYSYGAECVDD